MPEPPTQTRDGRFIFWADSVTTNTLDETANGANIAPPVPLAIQTERLSKTVENDGQPLSVLDEVDFHAEEGEFVAIIGPSGCGKSTLLNIIAGLDEPTAGALSLGGAAQNGPDGSGGSGGRLGSVGYMQQKDLLMPWRSVLDNAALGLEIRGVPKREAVARAREHLPRFGLDGFEGAYPHELSGGMRQRAAFLRTALADQQVFLLDEPFGALDALNRAQIHEWLTGLWESMRKTIVLVTHDVDEAIFLSDRVYVMTARPGTMKIVLPVNLPRPRSVDALASAEFMRLKAALLNAIREEADA